jgi:hypothetical protein
VTAVLGFPGRGAVDTSNGAPMGAKYFWAAALQPSSNIKYQRHVLSQVGRGRGRGAVATSGCEVR